MRKFLFALWIGLALTASSLHAARDDERITQLREEIRALETAAADNANASERPRLDRRLDMLRQELSILEKRQALEKQERGLRTGQNLSAIEQLREKLQSVAPDTSAADAQLHELAGKRAMATLERDAIARKISDLPKAATGDVAAAAERATLDEKLYTANEQLRALALLQEAIEGEIDLINQAKALREQVRAVEGPGRASLRALFNQRLHARETSGAVALWNERIANFDESLHNSEAALALARQKLVKFDEELQLLEKQTNFLRRNPRLEQYLASERAQKELLGVRLPSLADQVDAIRKSRETLQTRKDLSLLETKFLADQLEDMQSSYLRQLYVPATVALAIIVIYAVASRVLLPRRYKKEELFLARRLGRYGVGLLVVLVLAFYLIEDITLLATTLGLVSAAIVISVQDLLASFFGWFTIMLGRKFTIGDRLEIDGVRGDVLDIQILRTTLIEVNNWLGVDQPTGRVLFVPNNFIFKSKVFNFSHGHPYIWGKIEVTVTFGTPVASATALFTKVLEEETRDDFSAARAAAAEMERRYGVEDAEYRPKLYTRIGDHGVTFSMIYVSHYRASSSTRNKINRRLIAELETHKHIQLAYNTLTVIPTTSAQDGPSAVLGSDATQAPFMVRRT